MQKNLSKQLDKKYHAKSLQGIWSMEACVGDALFSFPLSSQVGSCCTGQMNLESDPKHSCMEALNRVLNSYVDVSFKKGLAQARYFVVGFCKHPTEQCEGSLMSKQLPFTTVFMCLLCSMRVYETRW